MRAGNWNNTRGDTGGTGNDHGDATKSIMNTTSMLKKPIRKP